jgi:2-dehydropantoate 2-reductase
VIIAVKGPSLAEVVEQAAPSIGPDTIIISFMNGITSEDILAERYGRSHVLDCIAIGMDAMRDGTRLSYTKCGKLQFGSRDGSQVEDVQAVRQYFAKAGVPHEVRDDIRRAMWYKYLLNVGVNQACTVYETGYGHVTSPGPICDEMKEAMREVCRLAAVEGITLTEDDINAAIELEKTLKPDGYPSMRQDAIAGRPTEVDLFAGTVIEMGRKYGIPTPVNQKYKNNLH